MRLKNSTIANILIIYCISFTMMRSLIGSIIGSLGNYLFIGMVLLGIVFYFILYKWMIVKISRRSFFLFLTLLLIFCVFNYLLLPNASSYSFYEYVFYFLTFFFWFYILSFVDPERIVKIYAFVSLIVGAEAIWEYITGNVPFRVSYTGQQLFRRAFGLVGSPLTLGMLLSCTALMCIYLARHQSKLYYFIFIVNLGGLICTQSRGPILSFLAGLMILLFFDGNYYDKKRNMTILKRLIMTTMTLLIIWAVVSILSRYNEFISTVYTRLRTALDWEASNASNYERSRRWNYAYNLFKNHVLIGYGVSATGAHSSSGIITESGVLKVLAEIGILGSLFYFGTLLSGVFPYIKRSLKRDVGMSALALSIVFAIFIENFVLQILESVTIFIILSLFIAFLLQSLATFDSDQNRIA